jgi:predicted nucleotidyltransferase
VLFHTDDAWARSRELARRHETGRAGSYYDDVEGTGHQAISFEL